MRKNIRRSLMVAAAASGVWALSTAGASAAELPVGSDAGRTAQGAVEQLEKAGHAGDTVTGTVKKATDATDATEATGTVEDAVRGVTGKLPSKGIPENGLPTNTLPAEGLSADALSADALPTGAADGVTGKLRGADSLGRTGDVHAVLGQVSDRTGHASKAVKEAQKDVRSAVPEVPAVPGVPAVPALPAIPAVPGAVTGRLTSHTLPAPALPGAPAVPKSAVPTVPGLPAVPEIPAVPGVPPVPAVPGVPSVPSVPSVPGVPSTDELAGDHAQEAVATVRAAVTPLHPVLDGATGTVLPPAARGVVVHVRPMAYQAATDAAVTVDGAAATTAPFARSTFVRTHALAHGATAGLDSFAHGVAADAVPYGHELAAGVKGDTQELVTHAVTSVRVIVTVPGKRDLTDPANVPGLAVARQVPAGL